MITQVHQASPERSISQLCETLQVSRSWYYENQTRAEEDGLLGPPEKFTTLSPQKAQKCKISRPLGTNERVAQVR